MSGKTKKERISPMGSDNSLKGVTAQINRMLDKKMPNLTTAEKVKLKAMKIGSFMKDLGIQKKTGGTVKKMRNGGKLVGGQSKIDRDKNGVINAKDFKIMNEKAYGGKAKKPVKKMYGGTAKKPAKKMIGGMAKKKKMMGGGMMKKKMMGGGMAKKKK
tara:strand:- start:969 stop:1442 length:474 start_codon:yes stop_codon:yes gene_type:complete